MRVGNLLLICPNFRGYEELLEKGIDEYGYEVTPVFYDENNVFSLPIAIKIILKLVLVVLKLLPISELTAIETHANVRQFFLCKLRFGSFNQWLMEEVDGQFDVVIVIKGFGIELNTIKKIDAKTKILYQWDSLIRYSSVKKIYSLFTKTYTFDKGDAEKGYGEYLPNFFIKDIKEQQKTDKIVYDILFIGMYTKDRHSILKQILQHCESNGLRFYIKLYLPRSIFVSKNLYKDPLITDKLISRDSYTKLLNASKSVVELSHSGQSGMTQRVLEALDKNKLIVSSEPIQELEILKSRSICFNTFFDMSKSDFERRLASLKLGQVEKDRFIASYTLERWLDFMLNTQS